MAKKKNNTESIEDIKDVLNEMNEENKNNKKQKKDIKTPKLKNEEISDILYKIFCFYCLITKKVNIYTRDDFSNEAAALNSLSKKYTIISYILTLFNPIVLIIGLTEKIIELNKANMKAENKNG